MRLAKTGHDARFPRTARTSDSLRTATSPKQLDHALLRIDALEDNNLLNQVFAVNDGEEALDFLYRRGK